VAAKAGDYSRAITLCRETLKIARIRHRLGDTGTALVGQGASYRSHRGGKKIHRKRPKSALFHADLASFYLRAGDRAAAETHARKALSIDPRNDLALTTIATCYLAARRDKEAIPFLTRLLAVRGGKDRAVSDTLIGSYRRAGDKAGAVRTRSRSRRPFRRTPICYLP
jgi:predicted Zn-dependent protease